MKIEKDYFLNDIFESEAKGILQDIMVSTSLVKHLNNLNIEKNNKIIEYIKNIFIEYYNSNYLDIQIYNNETILYGYAFSFIYPQLNSLYLHKIFVYEQYRDKGLGTKILNDLSESSYTITLLCPSNKKVFYIKNNFKDKGSFKVPNNENFKMSQMLYIGLSVMCNIKEQDNAPIFLLDDTDIQNIANILKT